jgi:hypothetical protein
MNGLEAGSMSSVAMNIKPALFKQWVAANKAGDQGS